jgi:hypothetical protein
VKNQQNDCVAAQLLVTFFRPPSESCRPRESTSGLRRILAKDRCEGYLRGMVVRHGSHASLQGFRLWGWQEYKFARAVPHRRSACIIARIVVSGPEIPA